MSSQLRRWAIGGAAIVALVLSGCAKKAEFDESGAVVSGMEGLSPTVQLGKEAPDFEIQDQHGELWKLSEFRGKAVLIDFWAYW